MIGIVLVSHSPALAKAALDLARQMVPRGGPRVAIAAGAGEGIIGTDATRVADAIAEAASPDGVLVLMDLGSAVLSAEFALELDPPACPVRLLAAPFVEGLLAALVRAAGGASLDEVAADALGALAPKQTQLPEDTGAQEAADVGNSAASDALRATVTLVNRDGLHARPAAALAEVLAGFDAKLGIHSLRTGRTISDASSMVFLMTLDARAGDTLELSASGADAAAALQKVRDIIESGFGEPLAGDSGAAIKPANSAAPAPTGSTTPLGVSPGLALAPVRHLAVVAEPSTAVVADREVEAALVAPAFTAIAASLSSRAGEDETAQILRASATLAGDPGLISSTQARVRETGVCAARAVWDELDAQAKLFESLGGRQGERAADLRELRGRLVAHLTGVPEPGLPDATEPFVLVAPELGPADAALLGTTGCVGLVLAQGGTTSHAAIIARSLGLPAVVWAAAADLPENSFVFIDGTKGIVEGNPGPERQSAVAVAARRPVFDGAGRTADGTPLPLRANLVAAGEVATAQAAHAQGVGLLRTEVLFLDRQDEPSVMEQTAQYREVLRGFGGDPVVIRTLDAGSDKPLAFVPEAAEPNPALGVRGFRTSWGSPGILDRQLQALAQALREVCAERAARAAKREGLSDQPEPQLWVMAPMIATAEEARDFVAHARAAGLGTAELPAKLGVMVETPSAALTADAVLAEVDFVSIGTNDLTQYAMAADRELGTLAQLGSVWQPAVLRLIGLIGEAGIRAAKHVSVCGEAGGDPALAPVLVGLGVTSLSMAPRSLGFVAGALAEVTLEQCRAAAHAARAASSSDAARAAAAIELTHS